MCMATVYLESGINRKEIMHDVVRIEVDKSTCCLTNLFGEGKRVEGTLKSIDFLEDHSVVIEHNADII
jgi:predicted RNA-binding protein